MTSMENHSKSIMAKVAPELIKDSIKGAWEKVKGYFKDLDAKESIEFGHAYEKYLENTELKHGKLNYHRLKAVG